MTRLSFRLPIVHTIPAPLAQSPCCHSGVIRHQSTYRGLQKSLGPGKKVTIRLWKWARQKLPTYLGARPPTKGERASPQYRMRLM